MINNVACYLEIIKPDIFILFFIFPIVLNSVVSVEYKNLKWI